MVNEATERLSEEGIERLVARRHALGDAVEWGLDYCKGRDLHTESIRKFKRLARDAAKLRGFIADDQDEAFRYFMEQLGPYVVKNAERVPEGVAAGSWQMIDPCYWAAEWCGERSLQDTPSWVNLQNEFLSLRANCLMTPSDERSTRALAVKVAPELQDFGPIAGTDASVAAGTPEGNPSDHGDPHNTAVDLGERRAAIASYVRECKDAGKRVNDQDIAKAASHSWNTRDPVTKWKAGKDRPGDDQRIRSVLRNKPHISNAG